MQAQAMQKYLFDRDFDDLEILREIVQQEVEEQELANAEPEVPSALAAPTFSEEEMAAARKQAYDKGKPDGVAEALGGIEQKISVSLNKIGNEVGSLFSTQRTNNDALAQDAAHLALAVAKKLFPRLHETHGLGEIVGVTEEILWKFGLEPIEVGRVYVHSGLPSSSEPALLVVDKKFLLSHLKLKLPRADLALVEVFLEVCF